MSINVEKTLKFYGMIQKNRTNRVVVEAVGPQYDNAMESTVRPAREHSGTGRRFRNISRR